MESRSDQVITIPHGQDWIFDKISSSITFQDAAEEKQFKSGLCCGMSLMWIQALLANDAATYTKRLMLIYQFESADKMQQAIKDVQQKKKLKKKLNSDEEIILSIPAFIDSALMHQRIWKYKEWFPEEGKSITGQEGMVSFQHTIPKTLEEQGGIHLGQVTEEKMKYTLSCAYSSTELVALLTSLTESLKNPDVSYPIGIELATKHAMQGVNHNIAIGYDPALKKWFFTDANRLPPKLTDTPEELAELILSAQCFDVSSLSSNAASTSPTRFTIFQASFFVADKHKDDFQRRLKSWSSTDEWTKMHDFAKKDLDFLFLNSMQDADKQVVSKFIQKTLQLGLNIDSSVIKAPVRADGKSPLHLLARVPSIETVKFVLTGLKVDANVRDKMGNTPLHDALLTKNPNLDVIKLLIEKGADPRIENQEGVTPIQLAKQTGDIDIINCLHAAKLALRSNQDSNAFPAISFFKPDEIVKNILNEKETKETGQKEYKEEDKNNSNTPK